METIFEETRDAGLAVVMHGDEQFTSRFGRVEALVTGRLVVLPPPPLPGVPGGAVARAA